MSTTTTYTGVRIVDMPDLGTFTSTSSLVGEHAGSGRFSAAGLGGYFLPLSGGTVSGVTNFYATDWMTPLVSWPMESSHIHMLSPNGQCALVGASQSTDGPSGACIGISGYAFNNSTVPNAYAWAGYFEGRQYTTTAATTDGLEVEIANVSGVDAAPPTPYGLPAPVSVGIQIASGAGVSLDTPALTAKIASAAIFICPNESYFRTGIVFAADAIAGVDGFGTGGTAGPAISLAVGQGIQWYEPSGAQGPTIVSTQTTGTPLGILFSNTGMFIGQASAEYLALVTATLSLGQTVMQLRVYNTAGITNAPVTLGAPDSGGAGYRVLRVPN
jgi:hypothetical protein